MSPEYQEAFEALDRAIHRVGDPLDPQRAVVEIPFETALVLRHLIDDLAHLAEEADARTQFSPANQTPVLSQ